MGAGTAVPAPAAAPDLALASPDAVPENQGPQPAVVAAPRQTEVTGPSVRPPAGQDPAEGCAPATGRPCARQQAAAQAAATTTTTTTTTKPPVAAVQTASSLPKTGATTYFLQLAAYGTEKIARDLAAKLAPTYPALVLTPPTQGTTVFKVVIGPLNRAESGTLLTWFRYRGIPRRVPEAGIARRAFPMTRKEAQKRVAELSRTLRDYQRAYFVDSRPLVSDAEYDRLFDELSAPRDPVSRPRFGRTPPPDASAPTSRRSFPKSAHTIPVLSLDKSYTAEELSAWIAKTVAQRGAGALLRLRGKDRRRLDRPVLRGGPPRPRRHPGQRAGGQRRDGKREDHRRVPLRLPRPVTVAVRGEIFLARSLFDSINANMEEPYANPRNFASGSLRRVKSSEVAGIPLGIFVYEGYFAQRGSDAPRDTGGAGATSGSA